MTRYRRLRRPCLAALLSAAAAHAGAATLDFNALTTPVQTFVNPVSLQGFTISNDCAFQPQCLGVWASTSSDQADPGRAAVFVNSPFTVTTLVRSDGAPFSFGAIDLADVYDDGATVTVEFQFSHADTHQSLRKVTLDRAIGLETFVFNIADLNAVSWRTIAGANGFNQFDDIVVDEVVVPLPATLPLLATGLAGAGVLRRRTRARATLAPRPA